MKGPAVLFKTLEVQLRRMLDERVRFRLRADKSKLTIIRVPYFDAAAHPVVQLSYVRLTTLYSL